MLATKASYARRFEDWAFQFQTAQAELKQAAKQVAAAEIRVAIVQASRDTHELQVENAKAIDEYMRSKLTNQDLYEWMGDRLMDVYYEAYKLAYDMSRRAERAMRAELATPDEEPRFVTFGYWDSARRGLGAGEQLQQALRALDVAYHERNRRELEVTKHISLRALAPAELMKLRETGTCTMELGEEQFDYDHLGHYARRIKSVSLTIPAVTGPYASVNCKLTLLKNKMRRKATPATSYGEASPDPRFASDMAPIESIVTSSGQNDSGLFEVMLQDERYLPFEGAGAISEWRIDLPAKTNTFDISAIQDVVLHMRYTARDGGEPLRVAADAAAFTNPRALQHLISLRTEFPESWEAFMNPGPEDTEQTLTFDLVQAQFPYLHGGNLIDATGMQVFAKWSAGTGSLDLDVTAPGEAEASVGLANDPTYGLLAVADLPVPAAPLDTWVVQAAIADMAALPALVDLWLLVTYNQVVG